MKVIALLLVTALCCPKAIQAEEHFVMDVSRGDLLREYFGAILVSDLVVGDKAFVPSFAFCRKEDSLMIRSDAEILVDESLEAARAMGDTYQITRGPGGRVSVELPESEGDGFEAIAMISLAETAVCSFFSSDETGGENLYLVTEVNGARSMSDLMTNFLPVGTED
jgi:hypothetical protein